MDEKLQTLLNDQVISEYGASMVYTQLAFEMDNLSFPGMRDWFMGQAAEERVHAEKIADHLLSRGYRVELNDIPVGSVKAANPQDAFQASLEHEQKVSEEIRTIARAALEAYTNGQHRLGLDVTLSGIYAALHQPGVQRVDLASPTANLVVNRQSASYCTAINLTDGGLDE